LRGILIFFNKEFKNHLLFLRGMNNPEKCSSCSSDGHLKETIIIGVAWPYANGYLHLGHVAGSLLPPDIFSRYHRMRGNRVLMVSGSDEHGTPITVRAESEGKNPQEIVDFFHSQTLRDLESLKIEFDLFTRTTHPNHCKVVQDVFMTLHDQGHIYPQTTTELFCKRCEKFLPDRYVHGICPNCHTENARGDQCDVCSRTYNAIELIDPVCKICGNTPVSRDTEHFFFRLSSFSERLLQFLEDKTHWKSRVLNFTRNWITEGLRDRPITRDISWGVPVPFEGYESKRIYVWFDAVIGYLSSSKQWAEEIVGNPEAWKDFWLNPAAKSYYFLGKDNIPFHTIIWPAMLMGYSDGKDQDYSVPYDVPANEYLRLGGEKFTKSGGIGVEVSSFMKEYLADEVRYYLSIIMPENRDVDFDLQEFKIHINNELVATFGNFIHRVLSFAGANFGKIPPAAKLEEEDERALLEIEDAGKRIAGFIETCQFKSGIKEIMTLAAYGNRYLGERAPWHLIKSDRQDCATVLNTGLRIVKALSIYAFPYLPVSMTNLHRILGFDDALSWDDAFTDFTYEQYSKDLVRPKPLFRLLEDKTKKPKKDKVRKLERPSEQSSAQKSSKTPDRLTGLGYSQPSALQASQAPEGQTEAQSVGHSKKSTKGKKPDGKKKNKELRQVGLKNLDLRVGKVLEVNDHPDADKLYILTVELGEDETRTLVAGLKNYYGKEELLGKNLIIVCNLKPAKLRGVVSRGMLLAAGKDKIVSVLKPDEKVPSGAPVTGHLVTEPELLEEISIQEFAAIPMTVHRIIEVRDTTLILEDGQDIEIGDLDVTGLLGKLVVIGEGNILRSPTCIVIPDKNIPVGAIIR